MGRQQHGSWSELSEVDIDWSGAFIRTVIYNSGCFKPAVETTSLAVDSPGPHSNILKLTVNLCVCPNFPCVKECHLSRVFSYFPIFSMSIVFTNKGAAVSKAPAKPCFPEMFWIPISSFHLTNIYWMTTMLGIALSLGIVGGNKSGKNLCSNGVYMAQCVLDTCIFSWTKEQMSLGSLGISFSFSDWTQCMAHAKQVLYYWAMCQPTGHC